MKNKFRIHTLGCRTNKYESQAYHDQLTKLGWEHSEDFADIHIINTCFVTRSAEKASKEIVEGLLSDEVFSTIVVTGCGAQIFKEYSSERLLIVPNLDKERLVSVLCSRGLISLKMQPTDLALANSTPIEHPDLLKDVPAFKISNFYNQTRAFIKIQDGCNNFCTYCVIPFVRGRSRSRPIDDILEEARGLVDNGFKEVVLTGINIGDYNFEGKTLADLVSALDEIEGLYRIRLSSIDPDKVDDNLLNTILNGKKTCSSMHISLQSGSDKILKKMNRNYSSGDFLKLIDKIKLLDDDFTFTTDIIVGFPGEEDSDFEESLSVIKHAGFAKVHMFPFSKRKGTLAEKFPFQVPREIINSRKKILMECAEKTAFDLRERYVGRKVQVLLEKKTFEERYIFGHLDNFLPVAVDLNSLKKNKNRENFDAKEHGSSKDLSYKELKMNNSIVDVVITQNLKDSLSGEFL